ncbi:MAG: UDP-N-acetylglucosamine--N-acetylmuramyl-(pentapeptide) pyrophosphoryl-undecaprenol N-acetylglucosamine transferase, partial [Flavobacteriales bacterium]
AVSDLVVSRAGASSVSEMAVAGKPSILVPSPNVAEDHQTKNALAMVNRQAAIMVKDEQAHNRLVDESLSLIVDSQKLGQLSSNISQLAMPDAADSIVQEVYQLINSTR